VNYILKQISVDANNKYAQMISLVI